MKTAAIICELNPLHTGHKRLIDYAKTLADKVICIMSGNFTQRGMPACADKFSRAKHAIAAGADMVVELPVAFATASAENFAWGGVHIAKTLRADCLVFGSECEKLQTICDCADMLELPETQLKIREQIKKGSSYPKAVALATQMPVLDQPNNVLALEYIRALRKLHCNAIPFNLQREDNYNKLQAGKFASSNLLRAEPDLRAKYSYDFVTKDIDDTVETNYKNFANSFLSVATKEYLENIEGVTEGLHNRICDADKTQGFEKMLDNVKTKRYTRLKLQRVILNCILGITKNEIEEYKTEFPPTKTLAVKADSLALLSEVNDGTDEITRRADRLYATLTDKNIVFPTKLVVL